MNIVGITGMNLFFAFIVAQTIYGKRKDPYQSNEDRDRLIEINFQALAFISIAATIFVSISIVLSALELRHLTPIVQSVYFQLISGVQLPAPCASTTSTSRSTARTR